MGGSRARLLVAIVVAVLLLTAGCVAKKDGPKEEVLRSWSRDKPSDETSDVTFDVPKGLDRIRVVVSTEPPDSGGFDWADCASGGNCYDWMQGGDEPSGTVTVTIWDSANTQRARFPLGYDQRDEAVFTEPVSGQWRAKVTYGGYDGPVSMKVSEPVAGGGGLGGSFWDILGVFLALGMATGGWIIYRRRRGYLSRQLDRIDTTFRDFSEDVSECRENLVEMKEQLALMLRRNKLEESQYIILEKRIDQYLHDLETPGNRHAKGEGASGKGEALERIRRPSD